MKDRNNLYLIFDLDVISCADLDKLFDMAEGFLNSGVDILQVRFSEKWSARFVCALAERLAGSFDKAIVVNNRADIAKIANAGLHIGQDDLDPVKLDGFGLPLIGLSCHSGEEILRAQDLPVDYFSIGPIFPTRTKPEYKVVGMELLKKWYNEVDKPFVAIGGMDSERIKIIKDFNPWAIAVCRDILESKGPNEKIREYTAILNGA